MTTTIGAKTTFIFPGGKFEDHYLKVVTIVTKRLTLIFKENLESGLEGELMYVAAKYHSYDEALDGHDEWVQKAKRGEVTFDPSPKEI